MARKKQKSSGDEVPAWLITFSDIMTLLLTFFVLLLSMAVIDKKRKLEVLGSVRATFNVMGQDRMFAPLSKKSTKSDKDAGPIEDDGVADLQEMQDKLMEEIDADLAFQSNKNIQILSINHDVLFRRGETALSESGKRLLRQMAVYLIQIEHPILLAGHAASVRDEVGAGYLTPKDTKGWVSPTWMISLQRVNEIYRYLVYQGVPEGKIMVEAFGHYRPRYNNQTPDGRQKNRRVDIVLDKRNLEWIKKIEAMKSARPVQDTFNFKDFEFKLETPARNTPVVPSPLPGQPPRGSE